MEDKLLLATVLDVLDLRGEGEVVVEELGEHGEGVGEAGRVDEVGPVEAGADQPGVGEDGVRPWLFALVRLLRGWGANMVRYEG